jgi:hypothetical protein
VLVNWWPPATAGGHLKHVVAEKKSQAGTQARDLWRVGPGTVGLLIPALAILIRLPMMRKHHSPHRIGPAASNTPVYFQLCPVGSTPAKGDDVTRGRHGLRQIPLSYTYDKSSSGRFGKGDSRYDACGSSWLRAYTAGRYAMKRRKSYAQHQRTGNSGGGKQTPKGDWRSPSGAEMPLRYWRRDCRLRKRRRYDA